MKTISLFNLSHFLRRAKGMFLLFIIPFLSLPVSSQPTNRIHFRQVNSLPVLKSIGDMLVYDDTLRVWDGSGWKNLFATGDSAWVSIDIDTIFIDAAYITNFAGFGIKIVPAGVADSNIWIGENSWPIGTTIGNLRTLIFREDEYIQDYMQGFRNDTAINAADTNYAWSADAIRKFVLAHAGSGGGQDFSYLQEHGIMLMNGDTAYADAHFYFNAGLNDLLYLGTSGTYGVFRIDNQGTGYALSVGRETGTDFLINEYGSTHFKDSIFMDSISCPTAYGGLIVDSITKLVFADSVVLESKYGLTDRLPELKKVLRIKENGEIEWIYYLKYSGDIALYTDNWNKLTPNGKFSVIQTALEHSLRYDRQLEKRYNRQLILIFIIGIIAILALIKRT